MKNERKMARHKRTPTLKILAFLALLVVLISGAIVLLMGSNFAVLEPRGTIADEQFDLIVFTTLLSLIIVVPVFSLTFYIVWKYRAGNKKATYDPEWDHNNYIEAAWWLIPAILIAVLAVVTWRTTHRLDPYKPIESDKPALSVHVISLDWKWLFIYPEQNIATVNYMQVPVDRPISLTLTSDAPMNSFWVPQLGGQIYSMAGMTSRLHLLADQAGTYNGASANISGEGFAGMKFKVRASSEREFENWISEARQNGEHLSWSAYQSLAQPSKDNPVAYYSPVASNLYTRIIGKYRNPAPQTGNRLFEAGGYAR